MDVEINRGDCIERPVTPEGEFTAAADGCKVNVTGTAGIVVSQGDKATYVQAYDTLQVSGEFSVKNNTGSHMVVTLTAVDEADSADATEVESSADEESGE